MGAFRRNACGGCWPCVASGSGVPERAITSTPASWTSQWISTPVASTHRRAASASSGPTPSPVINVTSWPMISLSPSAKLEVSETIQASKRALGGQRADGVPTEVPSPSGGEGRVRAGSGKKPEEFAVQLTFSSCPSSSRRFASRTASESVASPVDRVGQQLRVFPISAPHTPSGECPRREPKTVPSSSGRG